MENDSVFVLDADAQRKLDQELDEQRKRLMRKAMIRALGEDRNTATEADVTAVLKGKDVEKATKPWYYQCIEIFGIFIFFGILIAAFVMVVNLVFQIIPSGEDAYTSFIVGIIVPDGVLTGLYFNNKKSKS